MTLTFKFPADWKIFVVSLQLPGVRCLFCRLQSPAAQAAGGASIRLIGFASIWLQKCQGMLCRVTIRDHTKDNTAGAGVLPSSHASNLTCRGSPVTPGGCPVIAAGLHSGQRHADMMCAMRNPRHSLHHPPPDRLWVSSWPWRPSRRTAPTAPTLTPYLHCPTHTAPSAGTASQLNTHICCRQQQW